jgi:Fic family protein
MNPSDFKENFPGRLVKCPEGAWAFVPNPLPPDIKPSWGLYEPLSAADRAIAELAGAASHLPNPHLLIAPFMRREAVLSSRIEGTEASFEDVVAFEAAGSVPPSGAEDVREVINYVRALELGLELRKKLPICKRLICDVHRELMSGVRGGMKTPGEFRRVQNKIGGSDFQTSRFLPPPIPEMHEALDALETYINEDKALPPLVRLALIHYQFEAIHPFMDGNGRTGRLLITLSLCNDEILPLPLLYLSAFFEREKQTYTDHLLRVSQGGAWEEWVVFFLRGVAEQAKDGLTRSRRLLDLREKYRRRLQDEKASVNSIALVDHLVSSPSATVADVAKKLQLSAPGAQLVIDRLQAAGILSLHTKTRPRLYVAREILDIFTE